MFHTFPSSFVRPLQIPLNETLAELPAGGMAELTALIDPAWIEQVLQASSKARSGVASCRRSMRCGRWPMVRAVCLPATDSHELRDAQLGNYHQSELTLAGGLDELIMLFDRTQFSVAFLLD